MWTSKTDPKTSDQNRFLTRKMAVEIKRNLSTLHFLENWLLKTFTITLYNSASLCYRTAPYRFNCCQEADAIANRCCIICLRSVFVSIFFVYMFAVMSEYISLLHWHCLYMQVTLPLPLPLSYFLYCRHLVALSMLLQSKWCILEYKSLRVLKGICLTAEWSGLTEASLIKELS